MTSGPNPGFLRRWPGARKRTVTEVVVVEPLMWEGVAVACASCGAETGLELSTMLLAPGGDGVDEREVALVDCRAGHDLPEPQHPLVYPSMVHALAGAVAAGTDRQAALAGIGWRPHTYRSGGDGGHVHVAWDDDPLLALSVVADHPALVDAFGRCLG